MFTHAPENYDCPFCKIVKGVEDESFYTKQVDVFYRDDFITAFIASHWYPENKGHILIIPNEHIENIYVLPDELSDRIHRFAKKVAVSLKEVYLCDGVTTRQHNEPCGSQEVWHYHLHIFPRYENDDFYNSYGKDYFSSEEERARFAERLKDYFGKV